MTSRFEVHLVLLDPTEGREIQKTRPCLIISPDEMIQHIGTVIAAPLSTTGRAYPSRVPVTLQGRRGQVILDQIRTVDKGRLQQLLGRIGAATARRVLAVRNEMFAP